MTNKWIHRHLTDRKQFVHFDLHKSESLPIRCGVPQGSILGPLLFLIYINDINYSTRENILSFADDTTVILSDNDPTNLYSRANKCLDEVYQWFCANKLSLNASKTQYMVIQPGRINRHNLDNHRLVINGVTLKQTNKCKFLGISIDESLTWKSQICNINNKISRALFTLKQLKFSLPRESLLTLYYSLIHPHLIYGILAWGNAASAVLHKIDIIQKRAVRVIHNKKYNSHTDPLFKQSGILKIPDLYQLHIMLFMHDYINGKLPTSFNNIYSLNNDVQTNYITRQSHLFSVARTKSRFVDKLPLFHFPVVWNKLVTNLNFACSKNVLKTTLRSKYVNSYLLNVNCQNPLCLECH